MAPCPKDLPERSCCWLALPLLAAAFWCADWAGENLAVAQETVPASDRVVLELNGHSSRLTVRGTIVDYTGVSLTIRAPDSQSIRTYSAAEVVEVQTPQTEFHVKGLVGFAQGQIEQAERDLQKALDEQGTSETRPWVRREILALLVRCALDRGDQSAAAIRFIAIARSDPNTRHFRLAPLTWAAARPNENLRNQCLQWLNDPAEAAQLIAASVLLDDQRYGGEAQRAMQKLGQSSNLQVRELAQTQQWRLRLLAGDTSPLELTRWESRIESLQDALRGGPYYLLGQARMQRREYDQAARALLWLPIVYDQDPHLAARSEVDAAHALSHAGQRNEAAALYRETAQRFPRTPFAQEALQSLNALATAPANE